MKKVIALCLACVLALSLVACGGNSDSGNDDASNTTNSTENIQLDGENKNDVQQEEKEVKEWTFDNLDKKWTDNEFEKLLPPLPFENWTTKQEGNVYEMFTDKANADGSGMYYDYFAGYSVTLEQFGFKVTVNDKIDGKPYDYSASDVHGNSFSFKCGDGCAWVTITKAE